MTLKLYPPSKFKWKILQHFNKSKNVFVIQNSLKIKYNDFERVVILFCRWWEIVFGDLPLYWPALTIMQGNALLTGHYHTLNHPFLQIEGNCRLSAEFLEIAKTKPIVQFLVIVIFSKPSSSFYTSNKLGWLKFKFWCNSWTHNILSFLLQVPLFSSPKLYPVIFLSPIKKWGKA